MQAEYLGVEIAMDEIKRGLEATRGKPSGTVKTV